MTDQFIDTMGGDQGALPVEWPCPYCGAETLSMYECQTWEGRDGRRMSCSPCDTAFRVYCASGECRWQYVWGKSYPANDPDTPEPEWAEERKRMEWYTTGAEE